MAKLKYINESTLSTATLDLQNVTKCHKTSLLSNRRPSSPFMTFEAFKVASKFCDYLFSRSKLDWTAMKKIQREAFKIGSQRMVKANNYYWSEKKSMKDKLFFTYGEKKSNKLKRHKIIKFWKDKMIKSDTQYSFSTWTVSFA